MAFPWPNALTTELLDYVHDRMHNRKIRDLTDEFADAHQLGREATYSQYNRHNTILKHEKLPRRRLHRYYSDGFDKDVLRRLGSY